MHRSERQLAHEGAFWGTREHEELAPSQALHTAIGLPEALTWSEDDIVPLARKACHAS